MQLGQIPAGNSAAMGQAPIEHQWTQPRFIMQKVRPISEMPLATYNQIENEYGDNLEKICGDHENLIKVILEDEENLISKHRQHIDDVVDIIK